jgi:flagellar basal-body rod modification protein FlgD
MLSNAITTNPAAAAATQTGSTNSSTSSTSNSSSSAFGGGMDGMFMQLLVTQLENQDPLSPTDPSTFVTQLVGVTTLDQVTEINQLLQSDLGGSSSSGSGSQDSASLNNILGGL